MQDRYSLTSLALWALASFRYIFSVICPDNKLFCRDAVWSKVDHSWKRREIESFNNEVHPHLTLGRKSFSMVTSLFELSKIYQSLSYSQIYCCIHILKICPTAINVSAEKLSVPRLIIVGSDMRLRASITKCIHISLWDAKASQWSARFRIFQIFQIFQIFFASIYWKTWSIS